MIPYAGYDPTENERCVVRRGAQTNGPSQRLLTPALRRKLSGIQARHPEWSVTDALAVLSYQIGRFPPFTRQALYKQERRNAKT